MSEYPKIETLYERDEATHRLKSELVLKNRTYDLIKTWQFTEKIDGTNVRAVWDCARKTVIFYGRTDAAQIHTDLVNWLYQNVSPIRLAEVFPDADAVIYGEGYGAGIQRGGGYSPTKKLIVFDVLVAQKWWLNWESVCDVAGKLGLETVPFIGEMTLADATELVRAGFPSKLGDGVMRAEGIVGRPAETLFDKKGHRLVVKLKTRDF